MEHRVDSVAPGVVQRQHADLAAELARLKAAVRALMWKCEAISPDCSVGFVIKRLPEWAAVKEAAK